MAKAPLLTLPLFATILLPTAYGEEYLLYTPKPTETVQAPASPDQGILVRHIEVKRGDTLKKLSRKHLGRANWFPQVLLFNNIKNPDLIYTGDRLKVPVPPGRTVAGTKGGMTAQEPSKRKPAGSAASPAIAPAPPASPAPSPALVSPTAQPAPSAPVAQPAAPVSSDEQETFLQAKAAYRSGDYQKSLALFDQFLGSFPRSPLAADAALYRADSLLQLSVR